MNTGTPMREKRSANSIRVTVFFGNCATLAMYFPGKRAMALITIAKVHDVALAQVVRMKLESEDIPVHLGSEGFATLLGAQSGFSAVRVQVPAHFEDTARRIYAELMEALDHEQ
jgi:hypothetical protein